MRGWWLDGSAGSKVRNRGVLAERCGPKSLPELGVAVEQDAPTRPGHQETKTDATIRGRRRSPLTSRPTVIGCGLVVWLATGKARAAPAKSLSHRVG
jgi:hypothetical protein